ncbi:MAG TPA: agmatinase family protein [Chryseolinea sp.]
MPTKEQLINSFDPNGPGIAGNLFGLPFDHDSADLLILPLPWEITVSYHTGTSKGPEAILKASSQLDVFMNDIPDAWKLGVTMLPIPQELLEESKRLRAMAARHIARIESGEPFDIEDPILRTMNEASENLNIFVKSVTQKYLRAGKLVGLVGGEHSVPLGFIRALSEQYDRFGILQIDAHADLRKAYEGFTYSHASIMYNVLKLPAVGRLVQVGIRDYCDEEANVIQRAMGRVVTFLDEELKEKIYTGKTWDSLCDEIIGQLPKNVYISFDIDGLDPKLCPGTGTPVAGGLEFQQAVYLIKKLVLSGRKIIGFDLCEVSPGHDDWDANVGARVLYQLCNWCAVSHKKLALKKQAPLK